MADINYAGDNTLAAVASYIKEKIDDAAKAGEVVYTNEEIDNAVDDILS